MSKNITLFALCDIDISTTGSNNDLNVFLVDNKLSSKLLLLIARLIKTTPWLEYFF